MARLAIMIGWLCVTGVAQGQQDSTSSSPPPWFELTAGIHSPAGLLGIGVGIPVGKIITPAIAAGFGASEGKHISAGAEFQIDTHRLVDLRAFGYWTYTTGHQDKDFGGAGSRCTPGQMVKLGAAFVVHVDRTQLVVRAGYAWFVQEAMASEDYGGHIIGGQVGPNPVEGGVLLSVSMRFPLVASSEGY